ncbi:MAG: hypothetical protein ABW123_04575 [Cystobacter sp.]
MLSIQELRALGASLPSGAFRRQLGPFVLVQRAPGRPSSAVLEPTRVASANAIEQGMLSLLFEFEELLITTLPPLARVEALSVGRLPTATCSSMTPRCPSATPSCAGPRPRRAAR